MAKIHNKLMIPGPIQVHPDVLNVLNQPVEPYYGKEWVEKYSKVVSLLQRVFNTKNDVILMAGSGSCALDACLGSSLKTGENIIIANNGFFGDRLVSIAKQYFLKTIEVKAKWGEKINPDDVCKTLDAHPDVKSIGNSPK